LGIETVEFQVVKQLHLGRCTVFGRRTADWRIRRDGIARANRASRVTRVAETKRCHEHETGKPCPETSTNHSKPRSPLRFLIDIPGTVELFLALPEGTASSAVTNRDLQSSLLLETAPARSRELEKRELDEYKASPLFSDAERAALDYATELTRDKQVSQGTFNRLAGYFSEREICEIVRLVASEHLYYNVTNIGMNIHSDLLCDAVWV
jgi:hypothetical protein